MMGVTATILKCGDHNGSTHVCQCAVMMTTMITPTHHSGPNLRVSFILFWLLLALVLTSF